MLLYKRKNKRKIIHRFEKDESAYEAWLEQNPNGYVFHHFSGAKSTDFGKYNKLHRADCTILLRPIDAGRRTNIEKICSQDYKTIVKTIQELREDSWTTCQYCFK